MDYHVKKTDELYKGKVFNLVRQHILLPSGKHAEYDILQHPGAVTIVPIDSNTIFFVRQYRPATGGMLLELPAGTLEKGESPELCAHRELREEIGMDAVVLKKIGEFYLVPGYSTEYQYIYLAQDLSHSPLKGDDDEIIDVEPLPISQVINMVNTGQFRDAKTLASLAMVLPMINI